MEFIVEKDGNVSDVGIQSYQVLDNPNDDVENLDNPDDDKSSEDNKDNKNVTGDPNAHDDET